MISRLLSFDLDGTLVDTAAEIAYAANQTLADAGLAPRSLEEITLRIGGGAKLLMHSLLTDATATAQRASMPDGGTDFRNTDIDGLLQRFEHHYAQIAGTLAQPYAGCADTLERLRQAGIRLACVTNKEQVFAQQVLRATRLDGFFELLVGGDTLAHKKPHASVLDHVRNEFDCQPPQMAHVGDSRIDVQAARNAGIAAWAVSYGYNAGEPIAASLPDRLFDSLPAIAHYVA
jgi:phosphoglycolate phosphatase